MQSRKIARHPMDSLPDSTPVTVGMLRDSIDEAGQSVGFVLSRVLLEAGLDRNKAMRIALELHALTTQGIFPGPYGDAIAGIVLGINMHLQGTPEGVGKQA